MEGPTTYQVAMYKAELDEERRRQQPKWWETPEGAAFWADFDVQRSDVESEDVYRVLLEAKRVVKSLNSGVLASSSEEELVPVDVAIREIWQELTHEMRQDVVHHIPLRQLERLPRAAIVVAV